MSLFERIRHACAEVARRARQVRIDETGLAALVERFRREPPSSAAADPAHQRLADDESSLAFVLCLDAVNFGSGWFPLLRKPEGLSGYFTVAGALRRHFEEHGVPRAADWTRTRARDCARIFGQEGAHEAVGELMAHFARALGELGRFLLDRYGGRYAGPVEEAAGRAETLVALLAQMPGYRDVSTYDELEVPFYKRAQLTCADLATVFEGRGWGRFDDLDRLTIFADNLVPHVLRCDGVLRYDSELARRIDAAELLEAGSPEEVEIRASALHAVERCVDALAGEGASPSAQQLDYALWSRGQSPEIKARPRHRARSLYY